ncbi:MAG: nuclear transport factor 2 family protein [Sphingomonadaceae bacterium]
MPARDPEIEALLDEARITRLLGRYASMTDWLDFSGAAEIFTEDAQFDFGEMFRGDREGFIPFVTALESGYARRIHMFGLPRIDVDGDSARAECPSFIHARTAGDPEHTDATFVGRYIFDAVRTDAGWKLSRLAFYLNVLTVTNPPAGEEGPVNLADGWNLEHPDAPKG